MATTKPRPTFFLVRDFPFLIQSPKLNHHSQRSISIFVIRAGIYLTLLSLPYLAWNIALQVATEAREALLIVGDFLCLIPPVAFQIGIGSVIAVSVEADDPDLTWGEVWSWESRVWFTVLIMFVVGSIEWFYLWRLTTKRPATTALGKGEESEATPCDSSSNFGVSEETARSVVDDSGINARELVKLFRIKASRGAKRKGSILKKAVKGASFGVKKNEIVCLVGPNGAGYVYSSVHYPFCCSDESSHAV